MIFSKKPSHLAAWKADADEFGIPEATQKGMAFMLAIDFMVNLPVSDPKELEAHLKKLNNDAPFTEGKGFEVNDRKIAALLAEFAFQVIPDFTPVKYEGLNLFSFPYPKELRLPKFALELVKLADCDRLISTLYHQIGENVMTDIEGAYLAGFQFFKYYWEADEQSMVQIAMVASSHRPPHFLWFRDCLGFPAKELALGNPIQKILDSFLGALLDPSRMDLYNQIIYVNDLFHYVGKGVKNEAMWGLDVVSFGLSVACSPMNGNRTALPDSERELRNYLKAQGFSTINPCHSRGEAFQVLCQQIKEKWGYDVMDESEPLYPAQQWVRRCCLVFVAVANAILSPEWNAAAVPEEMRRSRKA
jgi:hypothetical protein